MAFISVEQAAILTGKSIPTIYRHIKDGKVSRHVEGLDTAELIRVYGAFKNTSETTFNFETLSKNENSELLLLRLENELLKENNNGLKIDKQNLQADKKNLQETIDYFQRQLNAPAAKEEPEAIIKVVGDKSESLTQRIVRKLFW